MEPKLQRKVKLSTNISDPLTFISTYIIGKNCVNLFTCESDPLVVLNKWHKIKKLSVKLKLDLCRREKQFLRKMRNPKN